MDDRKAFQMTLPEKRMSAGVLFFDRGGRLLVVRPTYKTTWEIPGGTIEANESPRACAAREVAEELGLAREPGRLLCVDYADETDYRTESVQFIFDGGVLSKAELAAIRLPLSELIEYRLLKPKKALRLLNRRLRRRVYHCLRARRAGVTYYMEEQKPVSF